MSYLSLEDEYFEVAIDLLKKEFLDIPFIIDEIFKQLLGSSPKYDPEFVSIKSFLSEIKVDLCELKTSYNLDFFEENTPGYELLSHIIFSKLPPTLQKELIRKVDSNYPKINQIFDSYNEVIKNLIKTGLRKNLIPAKLILSRGKRIIIRTTMQRKTFQHWKTLQQNLTKLLGIVNFAASTDTPWTIVQNTPPLNRDVLGVGRWASGFSAQVQAIELLWQRKQVLAIDCYGKENKLPRKCAICKSRGHVTPLCDKAEESGNS